MRKSSGLELAKKLGIPSSRGMEAIIKAQLIDAIATEIEAQELTHAEVAKAARLGRTTVTGILNGSLQRISIDRLLRLVEAVGLVAEIKLKKSAA